MYDKAINIALNIYVNTYILMNTSKQLNSRIRAKSMTSICSAIALGNVNIVPITHFYNKYKCIFLLVITICIESNEYVSFMRMCNLALIAIEVVDGFHSHKAPRLWLDPTYRKSIGSVVFSMLQLYSSSKILHFISQVCDLFGFVSLLCYYRNVWVINHGHWIQL